MIMRKLLLGLFILGAVAYGNEAEMKASATVLETLTVRVDRDVEFGNVAKGSSGNVAIGELSVRGELGSDVRIEIEGSETGVIPLKHTDGTTLNAILVSYPSAVKLTGNDFVRAEDVVMELDVPSDANMGKYEGKIFISARYN
jgi:hypothetical protein